MDTPAVRIRPAQHNDLEAMVLLLQALFAIEDDFTPDPARQRRGLSLLLEGCGKHRCILVAEAGTGVIAMATLQVLISTAQGGPVGLVEDVVVREDWRGRGVGRQILQTLAEWAAGRGLTRLQLLADGGHRPALDFYRKIGWQATRLVCLRHLPVVR